MYIYQVYIYIANGKILKHYSPNIYASQEIEEG
jgi:hypothetical protein